MPVLMFVLQANRQGSCLYISHLMIDGLMIENLWWWKLLLMMRYHASHMLIAWLIVSKFQY